MLQDAGLSPHEPRDLSTAEAIRTAEEDIEMFNQGLNWQQQTFNAQQRQKDFETKLALVKPDDPKPNDN